MAHWRHSVKNKGRVGCHAAAGLVYSVIAGALMFWPALQDHISLTWFAAGAVALNVAGEVLHFLGGRCGAED